MKTPHKIILGTLIVVASFIITYRAINLEPTKDIHPNEQVRAIVENSGCNLCHKENPKLPYYSKWPIIGDKIKRDAAKAVNKIDIYEIWIQFQRGEQIDIAKLESIEKVIYDSSMPPFSFTILRPGSAVNSKEGKILLEWIARRKPL
ncbi:MAG: heme-binding domain-containing protein [Bacteroidales bacterium]